MFRVVLIVWLAFSVLVSCSPPQEPLRIVSSPWPGYEPLYLARDLGYLNKESFSLTEMPSSNITWEAFSNGSADIATLTLDETLSLLAKGRKVKILMVMDISNGADVVVARPEIKNLRQLEGKRIGIVNIPLGLYMLSRMLEVAGLEAEDVTVIPMPEDKHESAYRKREADAIITFEPFKSRIEKLGGKVLFDSSMIPDEIFDLLIVREDVYQERYDEICLLGRQWLRTLDYIDNNKQLAAKSMGKRLGISADEFLLMLDSLDVPDIQENNYFLGTNPALLRPANKLAEIMYKKNMISKPVDPMLAIDPNYRECTKE